MDAFLGAQTAWLEANLRKGECIVEADEWGRAKLPKGAHQHWGRPGKRVLKAYCIEPRTGVVRETAYTMPSKKAAEHEDNGSPEPVRKPRPDLTAKGAAIVGDLRTDALHQALRERPISDDQFIAMLVLSLAGRNFTVMSGVAGQYRSNTLADIATLTEGGVLTRDMSTIRQAARWALIQVLSCRENQSTSGLGARHAGAAIDADAFLPNMATEAFLPALSRAALEQCAAATDVAAQARVKDTRAALIAKFAEGTFIYPGARFALTPAEVEASVVNTSFGDGGDDGDLGDEENEGTGRAEDGADPYSNPEPIEGDEDDANTSRTGVHAADAAVSSDHAAV